MAAHALQPVTANRSAPLPKGFCVLVPIPTAVTAWYLFARAQDQFASTFGFVVHVETDSTAGLFSSVPGLSALGGASSTDADILYAYLQSQAIVEEVDQRVDLREIWGRLHAEDPVFAFNPLGSIEDLTRYWNRMITISYDPGPAMIEIELRSFDPHSAKEVAQTVKLLSNELVNRIGSIARKDKTLMSQHELSRAEDRLSQARVALTKFRLTHRIVNPIADLEGEMSVIHRLQQVLADEIVELDLLQRNLTNDGNSQRRTAISDTRIVQSERRIQALRTRITQERKTLGDPSGNRDLAQLTGEYEQLAVAVEIAQQAYAMALATHEANRAAANQQTRYLAGYSPPTLAERAIYPRRWMILGSVFLVLTLAWAMIILAGYSFRDRH